VALGVGSSLEAMRTGPSVVVDRRRVELAMPGGGSCMRRSCWTITVQRTIWNQVLSIDSSSVGTTSIRRRRAYRVLLLPLLELLF